MSSAIVASQVCFRYPHSDLPAVADLELTVEPGELVVLAGPSGCGKTTVTRLLNALVPHFYEGQLYGSVQVFGRATTDRQMWEIASDVGSVFQNPRSQFFTTDPVSEIAFGCENLGLSEEVTRQRVATAIRDFELEPLRERSIFALSGGQKQRLACAAVAAAIPRLYVLDEPSANLDRVATAQLHDMMARWKASGAAVVVAEHRLDYLRELIDRLLVFEDGRVVREISGDTFRQMEDAELASFGLRPGTARALPSSATVPTGPCWERANEVEDVGENPSSAAVSIGSCWEVEGFEYRYRRRSVPGVRRGSAESVVRLDRLAFPARQVTALIGVNGVGKTTLSRWIAGQLPAKGGVLLEEGRKISRRERRKRVFLVLQDVNHQLVTESVDDEIELTLRLAGVREGVVEERGRILAVVDLVGMGERHPMSLSGGQKQRLAIGTALASKRDLIILDEPTSGLDLIHMQQVGVALRQLAQEGRTVLVATHDLDLVAGCADHVLSLEQTT